MAFIDISAITRIDYMKRKKRKRSAPEKSKQRSSGKSYIMGEIIALLACVPFLLMGVALIFIGKDEISSTLPCTAETKGVINDVSRTHTFRNGNHSRKYKYKATYSYEIDGIECTDYFVTAKWVHSGKKIRIRYDPDDPENKYVKGYDDAGNVLMLIVGIVWDAIFLLLVWFIIVMFRDARAGKKI